MPYVFTRNPELGKVKTRLVKPSVMLMHYRYTKPASAHHGTNRKVGCDKFVFMTLQLLKETFGKRMFIIRDQSKVT
jgi:hypothetical protein